MSIAQYNAFKTLHTVNGVVDDEFRNTLFVLNETGTFTGTDDCLFYMGEHLISYASYKKALALSASSTNDEFPTAKCVYDAIQALPHPMQYKGTLGTDGTITSLPSAASSNEGFTYKVITAGTYDSQEAKIGDVFISNGSAWTLIPSGDDIDDSWRNIKVNGTEELGSGVSTGAVDFDSSDDINATWTTIGNKIKFTHSNSVTAGTAGSSSDNTQIKTTGENITFQVPYVTYNSKGHVTSAGTHTETVLINLEDGLVRYDEEGIDVMIPDDIFMVKDLSYYDVQGRLQNTRETANSYVISKTGYYKFPLVYGNAITGDTINSSAYTNEGGTYQADFVNYEGNKITSPYIEKDTGVSAVSASIEISDTDDIIDEIGITSYPNEDCRFLRFRVKQVPSTGANAVISIRNGANNIMWSWHIWLWKESLEPVEIRNHEGNSYNILPVNLGSKYDSTGHLINWHYQWGRKDPMLLPESYNSNNNHAYYGTTSYSVENCAASVAESIKNPCTFYKSGNYKYNNNWVQLNYYYNFWDATCDSEGATEKVIVKTIYDPCPRGFTVPNARVFTGFTSTGDNTNTVGQFNVIGSFANGWYFKKNENDSVGAFFPASGWRYYSSGGLSGVGVEGVYWSAGVYSDTFACLMGFNSGNVVTLNRNFRAYAFPVRPVAI